MSLCSSSSRSHSPIYSDLCSRIHQQWICKRILNQMTLHKVKKDLMLTSTASSCIQFINIKKSYHVMHSFQPGKVEFFNFVLGAIEWNAAGFHNGVVFFCYEHFLQCGFKKQKQKKKQFTLSIFKLFTVIQSL